MEYIDHMTNAIESFREDKGGHITEYEKMIRRKNNHLLRNLNHEWTNIHNQLSIIQQKPQNEENWDLTD